MAMSLRHSAGNKFWPGFLAALKEIIDRSDKAALLQHARRAAESARVGVGWRRRFTEDGWNDWHGRVLAGSFWTSSSLDDEETTSHEEKLAEISAILRGGA